MRDVHSCGNTYRPSTRLWVSHRCNSIHSTPPTLPPRVRTPSSGTARETRGSTL